MMSRIPYFLIACVMGFAPLSVGAQSTTETEAPAAEEAPVEDAAPADEAPAEADAEAPASDAEQLPEQVVAVHGDWQIRCRTDDGSCFMYQLAIDARDIPIAEMIIVPLNSTDDRVAGVTILTPLLTLLTQGVALQIDNGTQQKYQFGWCSEAGCVARFAVRDDGLSQFKRGNKTRLTVISVENPDAPVILDVSLKGFTAAFEDLQQR